MQDIKRESGLQQHTTAKSQNVCRRRNTGTSAVLQNVKIFHRIHGKRQKSRARIVNCSSGEKKSSMGMDQ
jgi:hypothetical protein